jgi:hypothetical protein
MSATQIEQDVTQDPGPDIPPEPVGWLPWLHTAGLFAAAIVAAVIAVLILEALTGLGRAKVDTFTDPLGRDCTSLSQGHGLALSCAPKPLEDRIADGLRGQA